jgi:hypothetical protein
MPHESPWIEAVLGSFPKDDPRRESRRGILTETAAVIPPQWQGSAEPQALPRGVAARLRGPRRRAVDAWLFLLLGILLWNLLGSPAARYRLRGIALADGAIDSVVDRRVSHALNRLAGVSDYRRSPFPLILEEDFRRRLPPERHEVCLGTAGAESRDERWTKFRAEQLSPRAALADRFRARYDSGEEIGPELLDLADRIDPDNGYYPLIALQQTLSESPHTVGKPGLRQALWQRMESILDHDHIDNHFEPVMRQRLANWPPPVDFPDIARDRVWASYCLPDDYWFQEHGLRALFRVHAMEIARSGDRDAMRNFCDQLRRFLNQLNSPESGLSMGVVQHAAFLGALTAGGECRSLGLHAEARWFDELRSEIHSALAPLNTYRWRPDASSLNNRWYVDFDADPSPGRLAEHRMFESLWLTTAATVAGMMAIVLGILAIVGRRRLLGLPGRLASLLTPRDHLRILGIGIGLPAVLVLATLEIPILHPRGERIDLDDFCATVIKLGAFVTASLFLGTREIGLALHRRGGPLGLFPIASRWLLGLGLLALVCAPVASALLHAESLMLAGRRDWFWMGWFSVLLLACLAFIAGAWMMHLGGGRRLQLATTSILLGRHMILVALLLGLLIAVDRRIECGHVAHAMAERIDTPHAFAVLMRESEEHQQARRQVQEFLDTATLHADP